MVISRKPATLKPADKSVDLEKKAEKKLVAAQKTVAKGAKAIKPPPKRADNKKASAKKTATTQPAGTKTSTKPESPRADRPTSAWPFPSSDSES